MIRDDLIEKLGIDPLDIESTAMGQAGCDIYLARKAREDYFHYGVESKFQESLNIWSALKQCEDNAAKEKLTPMLVFRRSRSKNYAVVEWDEMLRILKENNDLKASIKKKKG